MTKVPRIEVDCPICDGKVSRSLNPLVDHFSRESFDLHRCEECQGLFLKNPPVPARMSEFYENSGGGAMRKTPGLIFRNLQRLNFLRDVKDLSPRLKAGDTILDFGCGDGAFSSFLKDQGYRAHAADVYSPDQWSHPGIPFRRIQMDARELQASDFLIKGKRPDAIVLRHVLEHLYSPARFLELVRELGVPHLLIIVPNTDSRLARFFGPGWYYWDPPRHMTFFTETTLKTLAEREGYRVHRHRKYGIDEVVTSWYREALLSGSESRARKFSPKGPLAALSSCASAFIADTVCCATLELKA